MHRAFAIAITLLVAAGGATAHGQMAVHDSATTARNTVTAIVKEYLLGLQREQHEQIRRMAQRLSLFTSLDRYVLEDVPRWRIHDFVDGEAEFLFAGRYHAALNYGDPTGAGYEIVRHPVLAATEALGRLTPAARRELTARLATLNVADATIIAGTNDSGQLRFNGRRELAAIDGLEAHVIDSSNQQSATAVLDKISGAVLIGARQRQARTQLLAAVVEQLLTDNKRARDAETSSINMQLTTWRDRRAANEAFVTGSSDALRTWRQP
jgi:hypothetical protein